MKWSRHFLTSLSNYIYYFFPIPDCHLAKARGERRPRHLPRGHGRRGGRQGGQAPPLHPLNTSARPGRRRRGTLQWGRAVGGGLILYQCLVLVSFKGVTNVKGN